MLVIKKSIKSSVKENTSRSFPQVANTHTHVGNAPEKFLSCVTYAL